MSRLLKGHKMYSLKKTVILSLFLFMCVIKSSQSIEKSCLYDFKQYRTFLRENVFKNDYTSNSIEMPVHIYRLIINTVNYFQNNNKKTNINPFYINTEINKLFSKLEELFKNNPKYINI